MNYKDKITPARLPLLLQSINWSEHSVVFPLPKKHTSICHLVRLTDSYGFFFQRRNQAVARYESHVLNWSYVLIPLTF